MTRTSRSTVPAMRGLGSKLVALPCLTVTVIVLAGGCTEERTEPASDPRPSSAHPPSATAGQANSKQSQSITRRNRHDSANPPIFISQSGTAHSSPSLSDSPDGTRTVSSRGPATLHFKVEQSTRLVWTNNDGKPFLARGSGISINSRRGRGEVHLSPGRYEVYVRGTAWKIALRPR